MKHHIKHHIKQQFIFLFFRNAKICIPLFFVQNFVLMTEVIESNVEEVRIHVQIHSDFSSINFERDAKTKLV